MSDAARYDPVEYWNARKNPNQRGQPALESGSRIWSYLADNIQDDDRIFEFGPGVGRLFPLYRGHALTTLDISQTYNDQVVDAAKANDVSVSQHFSDDPEARFPFATDAFDIGIACQVFIHVPFETVTHQLAELGRVGKRAVIISSHKSSWPSCPHDAAETDYCFNHEYFTALSNLGFLISDAVIYPDAKHFVFAKA